MDSTESTPLLSHFGSQLPSISNAIQHLRAHEIHAVNKDTILALCPEPLRLNPAKEIAFVLVVLLQLRTEERPQTPSSSWDRWSQERTAQFNADHLDNRALEAWSQFVDSWCSDVTLNDVIRTSFHFVDTNQHSVTLIDILCHDPTPKRLLSHRLLDLAIHRLWTAGDRESTSSSISPFLRMLDKMKRFSTPRVMHAVDLIMHIMYLVTLVHFVMYPPLISILSLPAAGMREIFITIFTLASSLRQPVTPHLFVFLSFAASFPSCPLPGDFSYGVVLLALTLYLIQLHLPYPPSPIFFCVHRTIPLSTFLWDGFKRAVYPVLLFFVPIYILSTYLLSFSLMDTFFRELEFMLSTHPAPMEARMTFLAFCVTVLIITITSLVMSTLNSASISDSRSDPWSRFSSRVGIESRITFTKVVSEYATPHFFPTPLNLVPLVFVRLPLALLYLTGKTHGRSALLLLEKALWTILVLPLSTVTAGIWLWGCL